MSKEKYLYNFPYQPYPQQCDLMTELYTVIENRKIGIFESPTGTGKSLSILCSGLHWILKNQIDETNQLEKHKTDIKNAENDFQTNIDWISAYDKKQKLSSKLNENIENLTKKQKLLDNIKSIKVKKSLVIEKKLFQQLKPEINLESDDNEFIVDYESDHQVDDLCDEDKEKEGSITKIYYCSRTHSQLSQVQKELLKTSYAEKIVTCSLGSRQNLCINMSVSKLKSMNLINEKCLDLHKRNNDSDKENCSPQAKKRRVKTSTKTCPFQSSSKTEEMSHRIIRTSMDIEQLYQDGLRIGSCPFYGVRNSLNRAHLVLMPYQNLLNPAARSASGIDLRDNIIVIDEAHNLSDTISAVNSVTLSLKEIQISIVQLDQYLARYLSRLSDTNRSYLQQLISVLNRLEQFLKKNPEKGESISCSRSSSFSCVEFVFQASLDEFKIDKLINYLNKSKLAFKLRCARNRQQTERENLDTVIIHKDVKKKTVASLFGPRHDRQVADVADRTFDQSLQATNDDETMTTTTGALLTVKNFLEAIYYSLDARILVDFEQSSLTFLVVDPGRYLTDIVKQCRSLIVVGGTMRPFSDFKDRLFKVAGCPDSKIHTFSCDHVIDASNQMRVMTLGVGLDCQPLKFTFENRNDDAMIDACGRVIISVLANTPKGSVVFFPSYRYMKEVVAVWKSSGVLSAIEQTKRSFFETQNSGQSENVLKAYSLAAKTAKGGAVLFAVIGAKMSEGINFDDDLARIVVIIGIPYPQKNSLVLQEKMRFVRAQYGSDAAVNMYENLAMKSLNQAIGRAIRHKSDYAAILLLDARFANIAKLSGDAGIEEKVGLPKWMMKAVSVHQDAASVLSELKMFFNNKK